MKACSIDLRERVVRAARAGQTLVSVAERFEVGVATVRRWVRLQEATDSLLPKRRTGRRPCISPAEHPSLLAQLETWPDATLAEHCERWAKMYGVRVNRSSMCRAIRALGWTRKKKVLRETERDEEALAAWLESAQALDVEDLMFVDECSVNLVMTPRYSRSPKGRRAIGSVPSARGPNITLIASLSLEGIGPAMTLEGAATGQVFDAYAERVLAPALKPRQVVLTPARRSKPSG